MAATETNAAGHSLVQSGPVDLSLPNARKCGNLPSEIRGIPAGVTSSRWLYLLITS